MYVVLLILLVTVIGSMGWMVAKSGKPYRATMSVSKQEAPDIINRTQLVKAKAMASRDRCLEAHSKVTTELQVI